MNGSLAVRDACPSWWQLGARVMGRNLTFGTLCKSSMGEWEVQLDSGSRVIRPDPDFWLPPSVASVTPQQLRRLVYEADRALCLAFGCGGLTEWGSLPDSVRTGGGDPRPMPLNRPELDGVRAVLVASVRAALADHIAA